MTIRFVLLALAISLPYGTPLSADDYRVRLQRIGYSDQPAEVEEPEEQVLQTVEIIARPGERFYSKTVMGKQTVTLSGKFRLTENGKIEMTIRYDDVIATGETVPAEEGRKSRALRVFRVNTATQITESQPQTLGVPLTSRNESAHPPVKSKERAVLLITKDQPAE